MTERECQALILKIISKVLSVSEEMVHLDTIIGDLPEWNSFHNIAVIEAIERGFEVKIPTEYLFEMEDVADIVSTVMDLKNA